MAIGGVATPDPIVDVQDNILYNTPENGTGNNYAIGYGYSSSGNLTSNYNDLFVTAGGGLFKIGKIGSLSQGPGTGLTLLSNWTTATGRDTPNSISE